MNNKRIHHVSQIMLNRHSIFTESLNIFFSNAGKTKKPAGI